jgi:hypothetical protein
VALRFLTKKNQHLYGAGFVLVTTFIGQPEYLLAAVSHGKAKFQRMLIYLFRSLGNTL